MARSFASQVLKPLLLFIIVVTSLITISAQDLLFKSYSIAEGLPQSQVYCALSDQNGYLWWGTQGGGLSRFDGINFENFSSGDGLNSAYISSLHQSDDQKIWIGSNRGLNVYQGGHFDKIENIDFKVNAITSSDKKDQLWLGTDRGVYFLKNDSIEYLRLAEIGRRPVLNIVHYKNDVLIATDDILWSLDSNGNLQRLMKTSVQDFFVYGDTLWIATYDKGILTYINQIKTHISEDELSQCTSILKDKKNKLWVGTRKKGLLKIELDSTGHKLLSYNTGLSHPHIKDLILDHNGRLWVASSGGGIACQSNKIFQHYNRSNGLLGQRIYDIHKDRDSTLWLSVSKKGLQSYTRGKFNHWSLDSVIPDTKIKSICSDSLGRLWIGTEGKGIAIKDSLGWFLIDRNEGLASNWFVEILSDAVGSIWAASYSEGLIKISDQGNRSFSFRNFNQSNGLPDNRITTIAIGPSNKLWFGTVKGHIGYIARNNEITVLESESISYPIRSIVFDQFDRLWLGTKGAGVWSVVLTDSIKKMERLSDVRKISSENIYLLAKDRSGHIWAGSERGVDHIILNPSGQIEEIISYDRQSGFTGIETCHNSFFADDDGTIWFGTMNGLMQYFPGKYNSSCDTPILHMEHIKIFYQDIQKTQWASRMNQYGTPEEDIHLPYKQNHLSFEFKAISQSYPEDINYRYVLEGAEEEWSPAGKSTQVNYANLSPGSYQFAVQASIDGCEWTKPLYSSFKIEEPFWKSDWFIPSLACLLIGLISLIGWQRVRSIRKKESQKRQQLELENSLLHLEQKALQLQMNPHFIFNALTVIQSLIASGKQRDAREQLNQFAQLIRGILYNSRKTQVSLKEEIDTLSKYLNIARNCQAIPFEFDITTDPEIDAENILLPPMLLQPFVENAVVHGVSHLSYPGKINISFTSKDELLNVHIEDNGVGRKKAKTLSEGKRPGHQSVSMEVTIQRLKNLMKSERYAPFEIRDRDLVDGHTGTIVELHIPVELKY